MSDNPISVGVLAALDPADWRSDAAAAVIKHVLSARCPGAVFDFRTTIVPVEPRRRSTWDAAATAAWPAGVSALIVDRSIEAADLARAGVGSGLIITTTLFDDVATLCALVASTVDPTAADTRRRMLEHLGVLPNVDGLDPLARASDLFGGALTVIDRMLIAQSMDAEAFDDDPCTGALAAGRTTAHAEQSTEFDRIIDLLDELDPAGMASATVRDQQISELEAEVDSLRAALHATLDELDAAGALRRSLEQRLETALLRSELAAP